MHEPQLVDRPIHYPATCACGSQAGPLVDTMIENHQGRLYACLRCITTWAGLLGFVPPSDAKAWDETRDGLLQTITRLEQERDHALASKVVSIDDLADEIRRRTAAPSAA